MRPDQYLDAVAGESAHFASAAAGSLAAPIGFLGSWLVRDLVAHLGAVYSTVIANATNPTSEWASPGDAANAPTDDTINEWFAERRTSLLATLAEADSTAPAWTCTGVKTVDWWQRRMAHETAVHRWDVETAAPTISDVRPIDSDLATDGVDEYLEVSLRYSSSRPNRVYPTQTLHLHRSDGPGEWMLATDADGTLVVTNEHGKGDAAVRGPASSLVVWLWGRPATGLEIFGDADVAAAWHALAP